MKTIHKANMGEIFCLSLDDDLHGGHDDRGYLEGDVRALDLHNLSHADLIDIHEGVMGKTF